MKLRTFLKNKGVETPLSVLNKQVLKGFPNIKGRTALKTLSDLKTLLVEENTTEFHSLAFLLAFSENRSTEKRIHPSELYGGCSRKIFYDLTDVPLSNVGASDPSADLAMLFMEGKMIHLYFQTLFYLAGVLKEAEAPVKSEEFMIDGRADGILEISKEKLVLEIKTMNSYGFKNLNAPLDSHVFQASIYAFILGIKRIAFIYYCKDNSQKKEFIVDRSEKMFLQAKEKITGIKNSLEDNSAPERVCPSNIDKKALTCVYCKHCFSHA